MSRSIIASTRLALLATPATVALAVAAQPVQVVKNKGGEKVEVIGA